MRVIRSPRTMQRQAMTWRQAGLRVGFVPTMGYLHDGHLSLVRRARREVGPQGVVVVSIYVNPTQFGPSEDLDRYPRDVRRDLRLCRQEGVDAVFLPSDDSMYPGRETGGYSTWVVEERLSRSMEGRSRPTHFRGVTTVVAKLFNLVLPEVAVFGAKDYQQAMIIRRMVTNLDFPVRILVAPTVREPDGLAMSSRNAYLTPAEREQATVLWRAIREARRRVRQAGSRGVSASVLQRAVEQLVARCPDARLDYVEFFQPDSLCPVKRVVRGTHMALAVWVGRTRLIDNGVLR